MYKNKFCVINSIRVKKSTIFNINKADFSHLVLDNFQDEDSYTEFLTEVPLKEPDSKRKPKR